MFRQEQKDAIEGTVKRFKKADRYLWNAKMRFGKTLSALEVVRRCGYSKTIIMTHRPAVDAGWFEDFRKIFSEEDGYLYGSLKTGYGLAKLLASGQKFIYFASIQDLRGSARVGGKFDKNDDVFDTVWDLVIVDEAHEGTQTALGDAVVKKIVKEGAGTKFLALSGTPFNIIGDFSDEDVYSWDYIMEQEMKSEWDRMHFGDHNPYSDLPELRIYTYDLADALGGGDYITFEDKAFNFREFFRTWTGDASADHDAMPPTAKVGDFVHERDVSSFLNLMTKPSDTSAYPFSNEEYRSMFRHTFWIVPGVREALALQRLLEAHPVFGNGAFDVVNVAGDGDPDDPGDEITLDRFVELVDDSSWEEFMPKGVTKEVFAGFKKYYDEDVFIAAGRHIRNQAVYADTLAPTERVQRIAALFSCFKNPDKETVLTPWRVVNMHMSDTIGGWSFWDDSFGELRDGGPAFVDRGDVTVRVLSDPASRVLEINSKTGLYPLYVAYGMFRQRCGDRFAEMGLDEQRGVWNGVVAENVFVVCKTPMAKAITRRTLAGYTGAAVNAHYFDDLVNIMENKAAHFLGKVSKPSYWKKAGTKMEFSAVVGNPPYQIHSNDTRSTSRDKPIYNHFVEAAFTVKPAYTSLIIPSKWMATGLGLGQFRENMLHDRRLSKMCDFPNSNDVFPAPVEVKGGVCYFLWDREHDGPCDVATVRGNDVYGPVERVLGEHDIFVRDHRALTVLEKVLSHGEESMVDLLSVDKEFGWTSNFDGFHDRGRHGDVPIYYNRNGRRLVGWIARDEIRKSEQLVDTWKVMVPKAGSDGGKKIPDIVLGSPMLAPNPSVCTQTYLFFYSNTEIESENIERYYKTKFFRFVVSLRKITQDATRQTYKWVPQQDFTKKWDDAKLYEKYGLSDEEIAYIERTIKSMD